MSPLLDSSALLCADISLIGMILFFGTLVVLRPHVNEVKGDLEALDWHCRWRKSELVWVGRFPLICFPPHFFSCASVRPLFPF